MYMYIREMKVPVLKEINCKTTYWVSSHFLHQLLLGKRVVFLGEADPWSGLVPRGPILIRVRRGPVIQGRGRRSRGQEGGSIVFHLVLVLTTQHTDEGN